MGQATISLLVYLMIIILATQVDTRKERVIFNNEVKKYILLNQFAFDMEGHLDVQLYNIVVNNEHDVLGLSLDRLKKEKMENYLARHGDHCILDNPASLRYDGPILLFIMDIPKSQVKIHCGPHWKNHHINRLKSLNPLYRGKRQIPLCKNHTLPLDHTTVNGRVYYNLSFTMQVKSYAETGHYNTYFHSCPNYKTNNKISFVADIVATNKDNYLSSDESLLPHIYLSLFAIYLGLSSVWYNILFIQNQSSARAHSYTFLLVLFKSISYLLYGIEYHTISEKGWSNRIWSVLFGVVDYFCEFFQFVVILMAACCWKFNRHTSSILNTMTLGALLTIKLLIFIFCTILKMTADRYDSFTLLGETVKFADLCACIGLIFIFKRTMKNLKKSYTNNGLQEYSYRKSITKHLLALSSKYHLFSRILSIIFGKSNFVVHRTWYFQAIFELSTIAFYFYSAKVLWPTIEFLKFYDPRRQHPQLLDRMELNLQ